MLLEGIHPKIVSEHLGHASISFTLEVYTHLLPDIQSEAAEAIDRILQTPPPNTSQPIRRKHPTHDGAPASLHRAFRGGKPTLPAGDTRVDTGVDADS
jgi:hypothetical protein